MKPRIRFRKRIAEFFKKHIHIHGWMMIQRSRADIVLHGEGCPDKHLRGFYITETCIGCHSVRNRVDLAINPWIA